MLQYQPNQDVYQPAPSAPGRASAYSTDGGSSEWSLPIRSQGYQAAPNQFRGPAMTNQQQARTNPTGEARWRSTINLPISAQGGAQNRPVSYAPQAMQPIAMPPSPTPVSPIASTAAAGNYAAASGNYNSCGGGNCSTGCCDTGCGGCESGCCEYDCCEYDCCDRGHKCWLSKLCCFGRSRDCCEDDCGCCSECEQCCCDDSDCYPPRCGGDRDCCGRHKKYCARSTCNMHPHYAYYPANHGYYYFRPYNYNHVELHKELASAMGLESIAPYSTEVFGRPYSELMVDSYEDASGHDEVLNPPRRSVSQLPDVQDILRSR